MGAWALGICWCGHPPLKRKAGQVGVLRPGSQGRCSPFIYSSDSKSCFATVACGLYKQLESQTTTYVFLGGLSTPRPQRSEEPPVSFSQPGPGTPPGEASGPSAKPVFVPQLCSSQVCGSPTREQHFIYTIKQMKTCSTAESCRPTCDRTRFSLQKEGGLTQAIMWRDLELC